MRIEISGMRWKYFAQVLSCPHVVSQLIDIHDQLGATIDLGKVLQENEEARRLDAEKTNEQLEQSLQNDGTILRVRKLPQECILDTL